MIARQLLRAVPIRSNNFVPCLYHEQALSGQRTLQNKHSVGYNRKKIFRTNELPPTDIYSLRDISFKLNGVIDHSNQHQKHPPHLVDIPAGYNNIEVWDEVIEDVISHSPYGRNVTQRSLMLYLITSCLENTHSRTESVPSSTMQSYLDYLIEKPEALEVCQSALWCYLQWCRRNNQTEGVVPLLRLLKERIKTWAPIFLQEIIKHELPDESEHDLVEYFAYMVCVHKDTKLWASAIPFLLRHNRKASAVRLIKDSLDIFEHHSNFIPFSDNLIKEFLDAFCYSDDSEQWTENRDVVENFLRYMNKLFFTFRVKSTPLLFADWFQCIPDEKWSAQVVSANEIRNGVCPVSGVQMTSSVLTENEHRTLKNAVQSSLLSQTIEDNRDVVKEFKPTKSNQWKHSGNHMPHDQQSMKFVELLLQRGPFDLVIDGANVIHTYKTKDVAYKAIRSFVETFRREVKKNAKVLFLARNYSAGELDQAYPEFVKTIDTCYFDTNTADDSYILYTAICSGRNCHFLSNDLFRNYKYYIFTKIGPEMAKIFQKFQSSMQITFSCSPRGLKVQFGTSVFPEVQESDRTWHFPFHQSKGDVDEKLLGGRLPGRYLCLYRTDLISQNQHLRTPPDDNKGIRGDVK